MTGIDPDADVDCPPLIETKLAPPRRNADWIERARLTRALDESSSAALTLVNAPLGFGKTVVAQTWCARRPGAALAWLSIDTNDNDPVRFWTYLATAIDRVRRGLGGRVLARLRGPRADLTAVVGELINGIVAFREPIVIVLDDLHRVTDPAVLASLTDAVDLLPANARIIATTRFDPPLPLSRLRSEGRLAEVRSRDLAFTVAEARSLLVGGARLQIEPTDVDLLVQRTEGWPAGLYLTMLWLRGQPEPATAIRSFSADHRHVADYLTDEVLTRIPPDRLAFLTRSAVLPRFSASVCDAVLERDDSAAILAAIERDNLFLIPLDARGEWFRYHHLFGALLQLRLVAGDPDLAAALHARASRWFLEADLIEEAVDHAFATADEAFVVEILLACRREVMERGTNATLLDWVQRLSEESLRANALLPATAALIAGVNGRPSTERRRLLDLAGARDAPVLARCLVHLGHAAWMGGDVASAVSHGRRAVALAREDGGEYVISALAALAQAMFLAGDLTGAGEAAADAVNRTFAPNNRYGYIGCLSYLALVELAHGRVHNAGQHAERAMGVLRSLDLRAAWIGGLAHIATAAVHEAAGRLAEAEREAARACTLFDREPDLPLAYSRLVLARIRVRRGLLAQATVDLQNAREEIAVFVDPGSLRALAAEIAEALADARRLGADAPPFEAPSAAEMNVLRLLVSDLSLREIAGELFISPNTARTHRRHLYRKLNVTSRGEAVARASALGLLAGSHPG